MALTLYAHPFSSYCQKVLIALRDNQGELLGQLSQVLPQLVLAMPGTAARSTLSPSNLAAPAAVSGGDAWDRIEARFDKPAGATVVGVLVSVYGETDYVSGVRNRLNSVYLDAVCALP